MYGSDIWGYNKTGTQVFDKLFQNFVRCTLHIKATTCNPIVYGECGRSPPSVYCHINVLCYYRRLLGMSENSISKSVFNGLHRLHQQGFPTWIGRTCALAEQYDIDLNGIMDMSTETFKAHSSEVIKRNFINRWTLDLCNTESRILKTYASYKCDFNTESYLEVISVPKYCIALSKLRSSSQNLEIERGRYVRPKRILDERVCMLCKVVDDEIHFVTSCCINETQRLSLYQKLITVDPEFTLLSNKDKFVYLMANRNQTVITWFAKFIYHSFHARNDKLYMPRV